MQIGKCCVYAQIMLFAWEKLLLKLRNLKLRISNNAFINCMKIEWESSSRPTRINKPIATFPCHSTMFAFSHDMSSTLVALGMMVSSAKDQCRSGWLSWLTKRSHPGSHDCLGNDGKFLPITSYIIAAILLRFFFARSSWWTSTPTSTLALSIQGPRYSRIVDALYSSKDVQGIDTSQHGFKHYLWLAKNCRWLWYLWSCQHQRRKRGLILHLTWETTAAASNSDWLTHLNLCSTVASSCVT